MHAIAKLGLAAVLLISGSSVAIAQDAGAGTDTSAGARTTTDATTTGSIPKNYGSVISSLQSAKMPDLATFDQAATVNCVGVSSLQGDATNNAQALDNALTQNEASVSSLRSSIQGNADLMGKLQTSCANVAGFDVNKIISVETAADGSFTFYVDDRA